MTVLKLKPIDTLFFGDGKPFNMGEDTLANGLFPPLPSTVYGALRSAYLLNVEDGLQAFLDNKGEDIKTNHNDIEESPLKEIVKKIGTVCSHGAFKIKTLFLERNGCRYFPMPLDMGLVSYRNNEAVVLDLLDLPENSSVPSLSKLIGTDDSDIKKPDEDYFIPKYYLEDYFYGIKNRHYPIRPLSYFIESEPKVGIGRNPDRTVKEGHLYRVNMSRLREDVTLNVWVEELEKTDLTDIIKLGAEGKTAFINDDNGFNMRETFKINDDIINLIKNRGRFRVVFLTPAIFKNSWQPEFEDVKLVTASIGKPVFVGGWDMVKGWHKPMYKAIPAGSVFYYEVSEKDETKLKKLLNSIHLKNHGERSHEGFGFAMVAVG